MKTSRLHFSGLFLLLCAAGVAPAGEMQEQYGLWTPLPAPESNTRIMKTTILIKGDGSVSGSADVAFQGRSAVEVRGYLSLFKKDPADHLVGFMLLNGGYDGTGKFESDNVSVSTDTFRYKATFKFKDFTRTPGPGAFAIRWVFAPKDFVEWLGTIASADGPSDFLCSIGSSREEYVFNFPKKLKIVTIPENFSHHAANLSYEATYRLMGNQLTAARQIEDRNQGRACTPAAVRDYKAFYEKVIPNLKAQVVYK